MTSGRTAALTALLLAALVRPAAAGSASLTDSQLRAIRTLVSRFMEAHQAPGSTFALGLGDRIVWNEGFGWADLENRVRATPSTEYRSASIGKPMTATAVMELRERGGLDLDAPIPKYCPEFPATRWPITI